MPKQKDCPLFLHKGSGQWAKKIKGKTVYFGANFDAAIDKWLVEKDYLLVGRKPPSRKSSGNTVEQLANLFHDHYTSKVGVGKVSQRHLDGCERTIKRFIELVGVGSQIEDLGPLDFARIHLALYKPAERKELKNGGKVRQIKQRSVVTVDGDVRRILIFLNWCRDKKLVGAIDTGDDFKPSSKAEVRKQRKGSKGRALTPEVILKIIDAATPQFRPLLMLCINGGIGNLDIAEMKESELPNLDGKEVWLDLPRGKTGADRRVLLWPETVKAIKDYLAVKYRPNSKRDSDVLFLTSHGNRWVRNEGGSHCDSISNAFTKIRKELKLTRGTFYDLRRTFATIGMGTKDVQAVKHCMGHIENKVDILAEIYVQEIQDERLKAVCNHVRTWLYGGVK